MAYRDIIQAESNVLHHWPFDEASGTSIEDEVDTEDATISGATLGQTGKVDGTSCSFDGTDDEGVTDSAIDLSSHDVLYVEGIFYFDNQTGDHIVWELTQNTNWYTTGLVLENNNTEAVVAVKGDVGWNRALYTALASGTWLHVVARYDKSASTDEVDLYLNGQVQTPTSRSHNSNNTNTFGNVPFYFMHRGSGGVIHCSGDIQHQAIYSDLSDAAILNHYKAAFSNPTITDVDGDETITTDQTNVVLTGTNFLSAQGVDGKLYLSSSSTWGAGTVVEQTSIDSWSDTSIQFDVTQGGLSPGTVYAWVQHNGELHNITGFELTLESSGNAFTCDADLPSLTGTAEFEQANEFEVVADLPKLEGLASFSNEAENEFTADGILSVPEGAGVFSQANEITVQGELPGLTGSAEFEQANELTAVAELPLPEAAANFEQTNSVEAAGELPVPAVSATFTNTEDNLFTSEGELPVPATVAAFEQKNDIVADGALPVPAGSGTFEQQNEIAVNAELPVPESSAIFEQENLLSAAGSLPVLVGDGNFSQENTSTIGGELPVPSGAGVFENVGDNLFAADGILPVLSAEAIFGRLNPPGRVVCSASERSVDSSASRDDLPEVGVSAQARRVEVDSIPREGEASP